MAALVPNVSIERLAERLFEWKWAILHRLTLVRRWFFPYRTYRLHSRNLTTSDAPLVSGPHWNPPKIWRRRGR